MSALGLVSKNKEINMKTGSSDSYPNLINYSDGKLQIQYDAVEINREDLDGSVRTSWDYKYVEIEGEPTRDVLIDAFISNIYTKDAELALINNKLIDHNPAEYEDYTNLRIHAKELADEVLEALNRL
jgi:hypothetical protein